MKKKKKILSGATSLLLIAVESTDFTASLSPKLKDIN